VSRGLDKEAIERRPSGVAPTVSSKKRDNSASDPKHERERKPNGEGVSSESLGGGGGGSAEEKRQAEYSPGRHVQVNRRRGPSRELVRGRDRDRGIRTQHLETMEEIGKFRTVAVNDLGRFHYQGNVSRMKYELRALEVKGLVRRRHVKVPRGSLEVVFLTKQGKRMFDRERKESGSRIQMRQGIYAGLVKPAEISHDAAIYRMYQAEAAGIRIQGGKIRRVVLDYELKESLFTSCQSQKSPSRGVPPAPTGSRPGEWPDRCRRQNPASGPAYRV
jgi:DNA-binding MarR family transcriptional regulator